MGRGEKFSRKSNSNRKVRSKDKGSDDSDEDYVVSNEEEAEESESDLAEYCPSSDGEASEESFNDLAEEEEDEELDGEEEDIWRRKAARSKQRKGRFGNWKIRGKRSRKRNKVVSDDEEDVDYEDGEEEDLKRTRKVGRPKAKAKAKAGSLCMQKNRRIAFGRRKVLFDKEDEDVDYGEGDKEDAEEEEGDMENVGREKLNDDFIVNGENGLITLGELDDASHDTGGENDGDYAEEDEYNDEDDEEFTPDEDVSLDEEEEEEEVAVVNRKKNTLKAKKTKKRNKRSGQGCKKRKKYSVAKKRSRKGGTKKPGQKRKRKSDEDDDDDDYDDDVDFVVDNIVVRKKSKKKKSSKWRSRYTVASDSDFVSSGASDYEYTISEEEREQVREASKLLRPNLRSVSTTKQTQVTEDSQQLQKSPPKKGKEKVEVANQEVIKQVCGICLSEEDRRRLRGTLDCCSHYFCFTCIMEWSKVESRCPLCKQRFRTISKPARSTLGVDLREVVIPVPERDQVYQPTEEELRSYLDPYENVICTECHQGGDDGLMLLCDLCDSSAHTYCVGLGHEVPDGNWYCEGCRPVALGSSSGSQAPSPSPDHRLINGRFNRPSPPVISGEFLETSLISSPRTPFLHGFGNLLSPRLPNGDVQTPGAPTLSRRRTLHRHIQNIINSNRLNNMAGRADGTLVANTGNGGFVAQQIDRCREIEASSQSQLAKTHETGTPLYTIFEDNNPSSSVQARELLSSRSDHLRREETIEDQFNTFVVDRPVNLGLWPGLADYNQQNQNSCIPNTVSVFRVAPEGDFSVAREQLQLTVKTHLKNLSRQMDLGQVTFNEIATCSIHTILAACGLDHRSSEVHLVPPPVTCFHGGGGGQMGSSSSLMKGCCSRCFDSFVKDVVKKIMETRQPHWLSLGL